LGAGIVDLRLVLSELRLQLGDQGFLRIGLLL
jgi:hypothetical protein